MKKRSLGRGLGELGVQELLSVATFTETTKPSSELNTLSVERLRPGKYQPRRQMSQDALQELADSIRAQGIIQPIVVRKTEVGFEIIAGERRWRAAQLAGLSEVPVVIRELTDEAALAISLIENIQRQDLNVIEEAGALQRLLDEFHMTHQEVAVAVGRSRASVTNLLRLLKLNTDVLLLVEQGHLDMGHARALLALEDQKQSDVANHIVERALSVREAENLIRKLQEAEQAPKEKTLLSNPDITRLQVNLSQRLGATVSIQQAHKGKGKLIIQYRTTDQLNAILERIH
ncbi:MAG: chromosome partitioning protein ParB [Coxiella sp. RIFCSPHIGHO2_12_FULL_44_14]|nr:MAG: chromosome partitioning protein ParB [Coxiella sp. RIFCSPHIGHO2_12_FULL_44_14]